MNHTFSVVITTCPDSQSAKRVTEALMEKRLAACIQSHKIESTYRWQGKLETASEIRLMIKTRSVLFDEIGAVVNAEVGYETPQLIAVPIVQGQQDYLDWIEAETQ